LPERLGDGIVGYGAHNSDFEGARQESFPPW
jgi:hypothetical protein